MSFIGLVVGENGIWQYTKNSAKRLSKQSDMPLLWISDTQA